MTAEFLDTIATQTGFGELVGTSQQAISKHVFSGTLVVGQSYRDWITAYCGKLRDEAAGRGGDDQNSLTRARTDDALASVQLKRLQIAEKVGTLVPVADVEPYLIAMVTAARTELLALPDKLVLEIKALYGVDIDPTLLTEKIHESLNHLANSLPELTAGADAPRDAKMAAATEINDD